jgi:hypothetical protein
VILQVNYYVDAKLGAKNYLKIESKTYSEILPPNIKSKLKIVLLDGSEESDNDLKNSRGKKKPNKSSKGKNRRPSDESDENDLNNGPANRDDSSESGKNGQNRPNRLQKGDKHGGKGKQGGDDGNLNDGDLDGEPKDSNEVEEDSTGKNGPKNGKQHGKNSNGTGKRPLKDRHGANKNDKANSDNKNKLDGKHGKLDGKHGKLNGANDKLDGKLDGDKSSKNTHKDRANQAHSEIPDGNLGQKQPDGKGEGNGGKSKELIADGGKDQKPGKKSGDTSDQEGLGHDGQTKNSPDQGKKGLDGQTEADQNGGQDADSIR